MKPDLLKESALSEHSAGIGPANRKMLRERAMELAIISGRLAQETSKSDWDQAKQELMGMGRRSAWRLGDLAPLPVPYPAHLTLADCAVPDDIALQQFAWLAMGC